MNFRTLLAGTIGAVIVAAPGVAGAQADVLPEPVPVNTEYTLVLRLPGGCEDTGTEAVRMLIPSGFGEPSPEAPEGWTVEVGTVDGQWEISWDGADNPLPGDSPAELRVTTVTPGIEAGYELATFQSCTDGSEVAWDGVENPAPLLGVAPEGVPAGEVPPIDAPTTTVDNAPTTTIDERFADNPWIVEDAGMTTSGDDGGGFSAIQGAGVGLLVLAGGLGVVSLRQRRAAKAQAGD